MQSQLSRRGFLQLAAGAVAGATLAACAPAGTGPQAGAGPAAEKVILNLWWFEGPVYDAMVKAYDIRDRLSAERICQIQDEGSKLSG